MLKFLGVDSETGRITLGLVISDENIKKLREGSPIHFHAEQMKMAGIICNEVVILWYETEEEAIEQLKKRGLITENTRIRDDINVKKPYNN